MTILQELIKLNEAITVASDEDEHAGAAELYSELEDILQDSLTDLKSQSGKESSYNIGGNLSKVVSGDVKLVKNYTDHGYAGSTTKWDLCLQVGNNISKKALDEVKKIFAEIKSEAEEYEPKKMEAHGDVFHAYFDDGSISCKYEYASSFCWVAIRKNKK